MPVPRSFARAIIAAAAVTSLSVYFVLKPPEVDTARWFRPPPSLGRTPRKELYLARDWTPSLGWNNCRYIIEAAINLALILDRTLILPPFVYGRDCLVDPRICSMYTPQGVDHDARLAEYGEAFPVGKQWQDRFVMPLEMFLDVQLLTEKAPVITFDEFVRRHSLGPSMGNRTGAWPEAFKAYVPHYTANFSVFAERSAVLVDKLPPTAISTSRPLPPCPQLNGPLPEHGKPLRQPDVATYTPTNTSCLQRQGLTPLYTYSDLLGAMKAPSFNDPMHFLGITEDLVGVEDILRDRTETVLHVAGAKLHERAPPGMTYFTTSEARTRFSRIVASAIRPPKPYLEVGARAAARMQQKAGGRGFLSGHIRRGDMLGLNWINMNMEEHFAMLRFALDGGLGVMSRNPELLQSAGLDPVRQRPLASDPIFVATNANTTEEMRILRAHQVVVIDDLLTPYDRQMLGFGGLFGDIEAIVAQVIMARSAYCVADTLSSVGSWILGMRNTAGVDRRLFGLIWSGVPDDQKST